MDKHTPTSRSSFREKPSRPWSSLRGWITGVIKILLIGALSFSIPPILITLGSYMYVHNSDRILPGVTMGDLDLSWQTVSEAEQLINVHWNLNDEISIVDIDDPGRSWVDRASAFGLSVDAGSTAYAGYQQGREGQGLESVENMLFILRSGATIDPIMSLDATIAKSHFEEWAERAYIPSQDDDINLEGRKIIITSATSGKAVDVLASLDMLIQDPMSLRIDHQMMPLVMATIPSQTYEMQEAIESLERVIHTEVSLNAYDPVTDEQFKWSPDDIELEKWIDITAENDVFKVELLPEVMYEYVEGINSMLGGERAFDMGHALANLESHLSEGDEIIDPIFIQYLPSSYIVQPGDNLVSISFKIGMPYWKLNESNPDLARRGLVVGEELVVPPKDDMLTLPVIPEKRIVISIVEQTMWVYEDHELILEHVISSGIPSSPTLPGIFQVNSHYENAYASIWDLTMPHFLGIYDAVPGLTNGIHGLPLLSSGRRLWADVLGNPASYGCIILDLDAAEQLFYWAEEGVVVEIRE